MMRRAALAAVVLMLLSTASVSAAQKQVNVANFNFSPTPIKVKLGTFVRWFNTTASTTHTSDADLFGLWGEGMSPGTTSDVVAFQRAGSFAYHCSIHTFMHGFVNVRMKATPKSGTTTTTFLIRVATANAPAGFIHDIQRRKGSAAFANWVSTTAQTVNAGGLTVGKWQFRSRLRRTSDSLATGYSPLLTVKVI